jgi:hypothetical protein
MRGMRSWLGAMAGAVGSLAVAANPAQAQDLTASGCGGYAFTICASWIGTVGTNTLTLQITNNGGTALNPSSAFTQIGIGNVTTDYNIGSFTAFIGGTNVTSNWVLEQDVNGFNTLTEDSFGVNTQSGINGALLSGQTGIFTFTLASGTFSASAFNDAQIAIHDQGGATGCPSSGKAVFDASEGNLITGGGFTNVVCPPGGGGGTGNVVPEPSTYILLGSGLLGIFGIASRRRRQA